MYKLVVLSLGDGDLRNGFPVVTVQFWESANSQPIKIKGSLPLAPELAELYTCWQSLYSALYLKPGFCSRVKIAPGAVTNFSEFEFDDLCQRLLNGINIWLNSEPFRKIDQQLRTYLERKDEIRVIIETDNDLLRRLPWHLWKFFEDYPQAEVAISAPEYKRAFKSPTKPRNARVKILAILGNSKGIDTEKDRAILEHLSDADTEFLVEPQLQELSHQLYQNWDILFFAGHSSSREKGIIQLNQTDSLTLDLLRAALQQAISNGLKLAIFNSCDGLALAQELAPLHIPQVIVMREAVPDVVAQEFLKYFLAAFSSGQSLYAAVRFAREKLRSLEGEYPCASWLPVIWQNPAEEPTSWNDWCSPISDNRIGSVEHAERDLEPNSRPSPKPDNSPLSTTEPKSRPAPKKRYTIAKVLLASLAVTAGVMGVRHLGMLQNWELQAFDQLVRQRPDEKPDPRILVVTINENDIKAQDPKFRRDSISDWALNRVLEKLEQLQPRAIGLDIYRDFPTPRLDLASRFANSELVTVCKVRSPFSGDPGIAPPPESPALQQSFSDVLQDPDGGVRRHLLAMDADPASPCTATYAFSVGLALRYLAAQGILAEATKDGFLQIKNVTFKPLQSHTSGYQKIDSAGHQVLLNYRSPRSPQYIADQVSLMQVLRGQLNPNLVKDRVVLIGNTASSFGDLWTTPFSLNESSRQLPGVLLQAQMLSQILSAVLDQRPLLWVWPIWGEAIWIWIWSLIGGVLVLRLRSPLILGLTGGFALGGLYALCFTLLLKGGWVPLVPSALALVVTSAIVINTIAIKNLDGRKKAQKKIEW